MAVDLTTANTGIFYRLGFYMGGAADVVAIMGGTATARVLSGASMQTRANTISTAASGAPVVRSQTEGIWSATSSWQSAQSAIFSQYRSIMEKVIIQQVDADANLASKDLTSALKELIRQMKASGSYIAASTVNSGSQTVVGSAVGGTPVIVLSTKNADGYILQTLFAEPITFKVTSDSYSGSTARQETLSVTGKASVSDVFAYNWPGGSGTSTSLSLVDAQLDNSGGNKLTNSDFETFTTANTADNWVIATGAAGTNVFSAGSSDAYTQSNALKITGDVGGTLTCLRQTFNTTPSTTVGAGGTSGTLLPSTQYAVNLFVKVSSTPAAGVLRIRLVNSSNTVLTDNAGNDASFTVALTGCNTSYVAYNGFLRTPATLASGYKLEVALSTAIDNGKSVYIDDLALTPVVSLYNGGPSVAAFASSTLVTKDDAWTITTTNTFGGFAQWLERFFSLRDKSLQFPYSGGGAAVSDSLIS